MEWHHPQSPQKKNFKKSVLVGEVMITVFWDCEGVVLVDVMPRGESFNSNTNIRMLTELQEHSKQFQPQKNPTEILWQHNSAKVHTSLKTLKSITKFDWSLLPHPPYAPNLKPLDFPLFGALKDTIHGSKFETDDDVIHPVRTWLH
jgi:histone-lysine N-methyltransferase SETMAR